MRKILVAIPLVAALAGCTFGSISSLPMEVEGIGTVYRYQGRANFSHQIEEADRMITEHCKSLGGHPIVVGRDMRDLGVVAMGGGSSVTTFSAVGTGPVVSGMARSAGGLSGGGLRNYNQEIFYKCVPD